MLNIKFEYLYRDEDNYKTFGELVFSNPDQLPLEHIQKGIESYLIEGCWFDPDTWRIPRFSFHCLNPFGLDDFLWYELTQLEYTEAAANSGPIGDLLVHLQNQQR
ncbi:hypothetical protein [Carboxylicivirga taeanensis]|uniref:hypothetical protein n=1 Tax=Carboxylicivirga taeanensis TaxID=1416875 RepID=UPI003F6E3E79